MSNGQYMTVSVRGIELEIKITHDHGYEPDTGAHEIEWEPISLSVEEYNALNITVKEEGEIYNQIYLKLSEDL